MSEIITKISTFVVLITVQSIYQQFDTSMIDIYFFLFFLSLLFHIFFIVRKIKKKSAATLFPF